MKDLKQTYQIIAPVEKVWQALVDPVEIEAWGAGPAKMEAVENSMFSLWGGDIFGTNTEVVPNKKLSQDWYAGNWPEPSRVTFTLRSRDDATEIELTQTNIPDSEYDEIKNGWEDYYLGKIKEYLEQ